MSKHVSTQKGGRMKAIFWTILLILIFSMFYCHYRYFMAGRVIKYENIQPTEQEKTLINTAYKYHGIWWAVEGRDGWYFYRNGKWCRIKQAK